MPGRPTYACSVCSERVPREFVHRNRAGAYICHACRAEQQNAGALTRLGKRVQRAALRVGRPTLYSVAAFLVALVVAYLIVMLAQ